MSTNGSHQNEDSPEAMGLVCRALIRATDKATLATIDHTNTDRPYASLVMIASHHDGLPILLLSDLAEHTQNIKENSNASLLIDGTGALDNPLTGARVTLQGTLAKSDDPIIQQRFMNRHPSARDYAGFGDFSFYKFNLARAHLVAGFGRIHWIEDSHVRCDLDRCEALIEAEEDIIEHMNEDHRDAIDLYAEMVSAGTGTCTGMWTMTGIDTEGLDLRSSGSVARLEFEDKIHNSEQARSALAQLAKQGRKSNV